MGLSRQLKTHRAIFDTVGTIYRKHTSPSKRKKSMGSGEARGGNRVQDFAPVNTVLELSPIWGKEEEKKKNEMA